MYKVAKYFYYTIVIAIVVYLLISIIVLKIKVNENNAIIKDIFDKVNTNIEIFKNSTLE